MSIYKSDARSVATSEDARTPIAWQHRNINYQQHVLPEKFKPGMLQRRGTPSMSESTSNEEDRRQRATRRLQRHLVQTIDARSYMPHVSGAAASESTSEQSHSSQATKLAAHLHDGRMPMTMLRPAQSVPLLMPTSVPLAWDTPAAYPLAYTTVPMPAPQVGYQLIPAHPPPPPAAARPTVSMYDLSAATPAHLTQLMPHIETKMPPMTRPIVVAENGTPGQLPVRQPKLLPDPSVAAHTVTGSSASSSGGRRKRRTWRGLSRVLAISAAMIALGVVVALVLMFITV